MSYENAIRELEEEIRKEEAEGDPNVALWRSQRAGALQGIIKVLRDAQAEGIPYEDYVAFEKEIMGNEAEEDGEGDS